MNNIDKIRALTKEKDELSARLAEAGERLEGLENHFQSGDKTAEIDWDNDERANTECPFAEGSIERHWWTRGYSYKWRILRAIQAEERIKQWEAQAKRADVALKD